MPTDDNPAALGPSQLRLRHQHGPYHPDLIPGACGRRRHKRHDDNRRDPCRSEHAQGLPQGSAFWRTLVRPVRALLALEECPQAFRRWCHARVWEQVFKAHQATAEPSGKRDAPGANPGEEFVEVRGAGRTSREALESEQAVTKTRPSEQQGQSAGAFRCSPGHLALHGAQGRASDYQGKVSFSNRILFRFFASARIFSYSRTS